MKKWIALGTTSLLLAGSLSAFAVTPNQTKDPQNSTFEAQVQQELSKITVAEQQGAVTQKEAEYFTQKIQKIRDKEYARETQGEMSPQETMVFQHQLERVSDKLQKTMEK